MSSGHFRYLPSTRKLIIRLKREVNAVSQLCSALNSRKRTPEAQRDPDFVVRQFRAPTVATILCATLAHIRGRIHAGRWTAPDQAKWIGDNLPALRDYQRAMVEAALAVPAKEKARRQDHEERKLAHQEQNAPERARRCGAV